MLRSSCRTVLFMLLLTWMIPGSEPSSPPPAMESADLEAFMDGTMAAVMASHALPGAVVAVVRNDDVLLLRGYGFADVDKNIPVDPGNTRFRTGSTGKLFTWTAVMQLVQVGKIDLDVDINAYLDDLRIPDTFPEPITMAHLMAHNAGFEDRAAGMAARKPEDRDSLKDWLRTHMPERVRPPGVISAYSNYGSALAGYIVERISGMPYEEYVQRHIFEPLGMKHTTCRQPPGDEDPVMTATPYRYYRSWHDKRDFLILNGMVPAGAHSTTAADMARFMIAHLQGGRLGDKRILSDDTTRRMHASLFSHAPGLPGNAHGFWEYTIQGHRVIAHSGDTLWYHTLMALVPEKGVGLFFSTHSAGRYGNPRMEVLENLLRRYFPGKEKPPVQVNMTRVESARFCGSYRVTRASYSTIEKILTLFSSFTVRPGENSRLVVSGSGRETQWLPVAPMRFSSPDGRSDLYFREDSRGRITHMFLERLPHAALEKLDGTKSPGLHLLCLALGLFFFIVTLIRWPGRWLLGRVCPPLREEHPDGVTGLPRWLMGVISLLNVSWLAAIAALGSDETGLLYGFPAAMGLIQWLSLLAAILTPAVLLAGLSAWKARRWGVCARVYTTLFSLSALLFVWVLWFYNLLGFKY